MTRLAMICLGAWVLVACAAEPPAAERLAELALDPGATAVAVVPGPDGSTLVTVANGPRGVLDVWVARAVEGPWELFGSSFAGSSPSQIVTGRVGGLDVLFVLATNEVQMIEVDPVEPGRLSFPVRILHDDGNTSIDAGDLDGDGDDELVAGGRGGIRVVGELAKALGAVPSHVPQLDRRTLQGRLATGAVAVTDGAAEVASAAAAEPLARIDPVTAEDAGALPESLLLPAVAAELVATGSAAYVARLDDGRLVDVTAAGAAFESGVVRIAPADGGVVAARQDGTLGRGDGTGGLDDLSLRFDEPPLLAVTGGILAAVEPTAGRLHLFRLHP